MPDPASSLATENLLIGIVDTLTSDPQASVALGRRLLDAFDALRVGAPLGATRHQLRPGPPGTPQGEGVCLALRASHRLEVPEILENVAEFLAVDAAGSHASVAVGRESAWTDQATSDRLIGYGQRAKTELLVAGSALDLAPEVNVTLMSHGGDGTGVVAALAAVGLHISGNDGVFVWMPEVSELAGQVTYRQLKMLAPAIDIAADATGREPADEDAIALTGTVTPLWRSGLAVLLLDPPVTTAAASGGFGARPKPATRWQTASGDGSAQP